MPAGDALLAQEHRVLVVLELDVSPGLGNALLDRGRFQQVLWNLLSNAVKFTPEGGRVSLRVRRPEGLLEAVVSDTGQGIEAEASRYVETHGGTVKGASRHPLGTADFSSLLLQAQGSGAKVIGLANAGGDTIGSVKQAAELGIMGSKQTVVPLLMFITDIHTLGLKTAQGMYLTEGFYWDLNADTRAWSRRYFEKHKRMPTMVHAGVYSSTMHYLKAVEAGNTDDGTKAIAKMKALLAHSSQPRKAAPSYPKAVENQIEKKQTKGKKKRKEEIIQHSTISYFY